MVVSRSDRFALATIILLLLISGCMHVFAVIGDDKAWLMLVAREWLAGKKLYVDVVEVNPPLILWLYAVPVWLSRHVKGLRDYQILGLMGLLGAVFSALLCVKLLSRHPMFRENRCRQVESALLLLGVFIFFTPQSFFFDREHIMLVFTFPYVLRFMPSLARQPLPVWLRLAIAAMATVGFCIKPHAIILLAAIELLFLLRERSAAILYSLENGIIYLGGMLYLFCVWHFTPEYITTILPMALATYSSFARHGSSLIFLPPAFFCAAFIFADFRLRYTSPYRRDIYYGIAIALVFLFHTVISNGWDYTYHPLMCMLVFLAGFVYCEYRWLKAENESQGLASRQFTFGMRGCIFVIAAQGIYMGLVTMASVGALAMDVRCRNEPRCVMQDPYLRYVHDNAVRSFGTITQDYPRWAAVVEQSGARWDTRFNHLWMLPRMLQERNAPVASHAWIMPYVASALADDLNTKKPQIVFVDTGRQFSIAPEHVDLLEFLGRNKAFKAAWSDYRYAASIDECNMPVLSIFKTGCKYDIYRRAKGVALTPESGSSGFSRQP